MSTKQVEVAIIGGGTAGMVAYRAAKKHTESVLLIEGETFGTTCARVGCMPSKLLIAAAESAHQFELAPAFGVFPEGKPRIDGKKVMERVRNERDRFVGFVLEDVEKYPEENKLKGHARFLDAHTLSVKDKEGQETRVEAKRIVIATGSRPSFPGSFRDLGDRLIVNDDVFSWDDLPESIAVFGPGVIGIELGQALHRLGVKTWVFGINKLLGPFTDEVVRDYATEVFASEFFLDTDANVTQMKRTEAGDGALLTYVDKEGTEQTIQVDYVLAATGRRPNVDNLGLENVELELDEKGVPKADPFIMQTSQPHIFIAGDASNQVPLLHEAADQGRIAGDNAGRFPDIRAGHRRSTLGIVFSDPQMAMVGQSRRELEESMGSCGCFEVGVVSFEKQGRSRVMLKNKGLLHVYGEHGTGRFLGAEMFGPEAEHIGHLLAWAHQQKMTVSEILDMPFYHPVVEEGVRTALRNLNAKLRLGPKEVERCLDCGPGC